MCAKENAVVFEVVNTTETQQGNLKATYTQHQHHLIIFCVLPDEISVHFQNQQTKSEYVAKICTLISKHIAAN